MESEKNFQEKYDELQEKLQLSIGKIVRDIAKTESGRERLRIMKENHENFTNCEMTHGNDSHENSK